MDLDFKDAETKVLAREVARIERIVCGNGKPSLEQQIRDMEKAIMLQVKEAVAHAKGNYEQDDADIRGMVREETATRKAETADIRQIVTRVERWVLVAMGMFIVFKYFGIDNISKMLK